MPWVPGGSVPAVLMKVPVVPVPVVLWTEVGPPVPGAPGLARQTGANPKKGSRGKYTYYGFASYLVICRQQVLRGAQDFLRRIFHIRLTQNNKVIC